MLGSVHTWEIKYYEDHRGNSPPLDFINAIKDPKERAKIDFDLNLLAEFGTSLGMPYARRIEGALWELRPGGIRLLYFAYLDKTFVILHGFRKKTRETPESEKRIARARMRELQKEK